MARVECCHPCRTVEWRRDIDINGNPIKFFRYVCVICDAVLEEWRKERKHYGELAEDGEEAD